MISRRERFKWPELPPDTDACWEWDGHLTQKGYGRFIRGGAPVYVHRVSYETYVGPIPEGAVVDHECHNIAVKLGLCTRSVCAHRKCINPRHLKLSTTSANNRDAMSITCLTCGGSKDVGERCRPCTTKRARAWWASRRVVCPTCGGVYSHYYGRKHTNSCGREEL